MLITVIARVGMFNCYASWIFEVQILEMFFNQPWARNRIYQYGITISMQFLGYGLAGLFRSCLVFPDYCIWPGTLATIVLNKSLHEKSSGISFRVGRLLFSRYRWLIGLSIISFVWHMLLFFC